MTEIVVNVQSKRKVSDVMEIKSQRCLREKKWLAMGNTCKRPTETAKRVEFSFREIIGGFADMMHFTEE